jgi:hypothetical protein
MYNMVIVYALSCTITGSPYEDDFYKKCSFGKDKL